MLLSETVKTVEYVDSRGRKYKVALPVTAPDSAASYGTVLGPADIDALGLPEPYATKLHNELYARDIISATDAAARRNDIMSAFFAVFRLDTQRIVDLYLDVAGN